MKTLWTLFAVCMFSLAMAQGTTNAVTTSATPITEKMNTPAFVLISTEYGDIKIRLYDETPLHRDNFIKLVKEKFFDSTLFHRVIPQFMIQGGDPTSKTAQPGQRLGMGDIGYRIPAEFNPALYHKRGVIAGARDGNPQKASSACQFYITQGRKYSDEELAQIAKSRGITWTEEQLKTYKEVGGTPHLDLAYTVFGEVVSGMEVVDKIVAEPRDMSDRPNKDIRMTVKMVEQ